MVVRPSIRIIYADIPFNSFHRCKSAFFCANSIYLLRKKREMRKKEIIKELLIRLDGKCGGDRYTCPKIIGADLYLHYNSNPVFWQCCDCEALFPVAYREKYKADEWERGYVLRPTCPCFLVKKGFLTKKHLFRVLRKKAKGE